MPAPNSNTAKVRLLTNRPPKIVRRALGAKRPVSARGIPEDTIGTERRDG
jgi:hypothetical protein